MSPRRYATLDADGDVPAEQLGNAGAASHPDLAAHDGLGLATQAELDAHGHSIAHSSTTGQTVNDHHTRDHAATHAAGGADPFLDGTAPSTQAFGDAAASGTATAAAKRDHMHALPANPVTAHEAASDPHPGYLTTAEGAAAFQPLDTDLTAIAALSTTAFGRALLGLADAAALAAAHSHGGGGALSLTTVEKNLGAPARNSGSFDITGLAGLTPGRPVLIQQAVGPYTGKGDLPDEAEMDQVNITAYVLNATTIRAFWHGAPLIGNVKFDYSVG